MHIMMLTTLGQKQTARPALLLWLAPIMKMKRTLPRKNLRRANVPLASCSPDVTSALRFPVVPRVRLFSRKCLSPLLMAAILLPFCGLRAAAPELHVFPTVQADAIGQKLQSAMVWADPSQNTPLWPGFQKGWDQVFQVPQRIL